MEKLVIEHAEIEETVTAYREYRRVSEAIEEAEERLRDKLDPEFRELLELELEELFPKREELERKLKIILIPTDPRDKKNVVVEIRGDAGGEEAAFVCCGSIQDVHSLCGAQKAGRVRY